ncbi:MAG: AmmeMemoRadiSam system protein B [Proteobacteria bacterium]|nr:AmmeMemoRadiSam system protein B [Pseudomonadota bacterium]MBU1584068.1 AmmeMemoRadiSam system protein B [Pseudomonadota bacterium]MBU2454052.1 AmmeMemoRadiSam system protein B [Pseudomonadota bacterium]MBU2628655.1 AmmeMemoRadiSam system protein B [Pseudomonadota bacterium]
METKKMAFAGSWYPASADQCEGSIQGFLKEKKAQTDDKDYRSFIGGIVPHAGWYYSGSIACRVIASLKSNEKIDTILLFGAHMHKQSEPFILAHGAVETPFGPIEVDSELVDKICAGISVRKRSALKFPDDNTLELQYPFIKYFFPNAKIVVCGVAPSFFATVIGAMAVTEAENLSRNIRIIGSTDMTHYGPDFGFTPVGTGQKAVEWVRNKNDRAAIAAMIKMDESNIIAQGLENKNMCCPGAAAATVAACKKLGAARVIELDYATSFEKSGSQSFVGYAGILYTLS